MAMGTGDATKLAAEIVQAALSSRSIELKGPSAGTATTTAASNGERDASYLSALLQGLVKTLTKI
ncbi:hypothetical protein [Variovorax sp. GB1P17]|uniref:hypothetical protein n=1 Tax=Variovorax sp. GB1P17 TaxID=3443740 RepID=UPI003F46D06B